MRHVVVGPGKTLRAERAELARLLKGTKFRVVYEDGLGDSPLADLPDWPKIRAVLEIAQVFSGLQLRNSSSVDVWRRLRAVEHRLHARDLPSAPWLLGTIWQYLANDDPDFYFSDEVRPETLLVTLDTWLELSVPENLAEKLVRNAVSPRLLMLLEDDDVNSLWFCGPQATPRIFAIRRSLQQG